MRVNWGKKQVASFCPELGCSTVTGLEACKGLRAKMGGNVMNFCPPGPYTNRADPCNRSISCAFARLLRAS